MGYGSAYKIPPSYKRKLALDIDDPRYATQRGHLRDKVAAVTQYLDQGLTVTEVAKKMGCSQPTMSRFIKKHFIDTRNRITFNTFKKGNAPR